MREGQKGFTSMLVIFILAWISLVQGTTGTRSDEEKISEAKKLFLDANRAISEGRFPDAHTIADNLIRDHASDHQIGLYLHLYVHAFYLLDEDFQEGVLRPTPPGIQARIKAMKAKSDKTVIDMVKLVMLADGLSGGFSVQYLNEVLDKFPDSAWADWAAIELGFAKIPGKWTATEERYAEFYNFGMNFMKTHPYTHLMPRLLCITANSRRRMSQDKPAKDDAVRMCQRILKDYPTAEYHCARARQILRELLGESYQEPEGCSEERDKLITLFYCHTPQLDEYKKYTTEYLNITKAVEGETQMESRKLGLTVVAYVLIPPAAIIVIAGLILLVVKKKASSRRKSRAT